MKISASNYQINNTNFKSVYPVVHWVREANGSYAPVSKIKYVQAFQEKLICYLNSNPLLTPKEIKELTKAKLKAEKEIITDGEEKISVDSLKKIIDIPSQYLRAYISSCDDGYRNALRGNKVRSFYDRVTSSSNDFIPTSFVLSGEDAKEFNKRFGEEIGRATKIYGKDSDEVKKAKWKYNNEGLKFVNNYLRRKKDANGRTQVLHTKFEIVRNNEGEITGFKYIDARFLPEFGPESPFEKLKRR